MRALLLAFVVMLGACGDNHKPQVTPGEDAGVDAGPTKLAPCLDRPDVLPRPPGGPLTCDLVPPGFVQTP